jgi:hypothetical protein
MGVAIAVSFVWLGMVLGISFIEAPVKFRAPGVTTQIGLGIGRLVFRVLNAAEAILAVVLLVTVIAGAPGPAALASAIVAVAALALQVFAVRPVLNRRTAVHRARGREGRGPRRRRSAPARRRVNPPTRRP